MQEQSTSTSWNRFRLEPKCFSEKEKQGNLTDVEETFSNLNGRLGLETGLTLVQVCQDA